MTAKQQILIIDDETDNLRILADILREQADVILAKNGQQGVRKATELKPDLILLDVVMQGMDGFDVITHLQRAAATSAIPVIFITALNDTQHEEKGFRLGACDYIHKPFHTAIVLARVKLHLQLRRQRAMLEKLANIDPLTGIANRRRFEEVLQKEWRLAVRNQTPMSLVFIDIDNFKQYNDHLGHAAGDKVLQQVATALSQRLQRPADLVARFGGEEFIVLLADSDRHGGMEVMEQCRQAIEQMHAQELNHDSRDQVTVSIGGYTCRPGIDTRPQNAIKMADQMLYRAKHQGKNQLLWCCDDNGICASPLSAPEDDTEKG